MIELKLKSIPSFEWKDLHKKIGKIIVCEPTDSCIHEGNFLAQVYFVDEKMTMYLLAEWDVRKPTPPESGE